MDSLVHMLLTRSDLRSSHAVIALTAVGTDVVRLADELRRRMDERDLSPRLRSTAMRRPLPECARWVQVTGGGEVSTLHLVLLALTTKDSEAGTLLREAELTVPMVLTAAARMQSQADLADGAFGARTDRGRQGPEVPELPRRDALTLGSRRATTLLNGLYGGPGFLLSETELDRLPAASRITLVFQLVSWAVLLLSVDVIAHEGAYWELALLPFVASSPAHVHPALIVATGCVLAVFSPWWLSLLVAVRLPLAWIDAWYDVERKRAETGMPEFSMRDLRRVSRAAARDLLTGSNPHSGEMPERRR